MTNKKVSAIAIGLSALALMIAAAPFVSRFFETGAPLPVCKVGSKVTIRERHFSRRDPEFSRLTVDEVVVESVNGDRAKIKTKLGYEVVASLNPFMPSYEERSTDPKDLYFEQNTIFGDAMSLFPLKVGNRSSNRVVGNTTQGGDKAWEYIYSCEVMGKEKVQVELGTFDTYKVVCNASGTKNFKNTYYYSSQIEKNLLLERDSVNPYYSELTAYTNP